MSGELEQGRRRLFVFKDICTELYEASDLCEFNKKGNIVYGQGYAKVIQMVMRTPHKDLLNMNGLTLEEVGILLRVTRERVRQYEEQVLGAAPKRAGTKKRISIGKLMSPEFNASLFPDGKKIDYMTNLRETMREMFGKEKEIR